MGWIKRNLIFVLSGGAALALLGLAVFFIIRGYSSNSAASATLGDLYSQLQNLNQSPVQPGSGDKDNTKRAKEQEQELGQWITNASAYFQPIHPIPEGVVTSKTYATALNSTVYQLQQEAKQANVGLPNQYYFSFQVQSSKLTISSGLAPLAQQLGEVKAVAEILFSAGVNDLESIQRARVSDDDVNGGLASDYIDDHPVTNELAIFTPYTVTFRSFTPEMAKVLTGFATSPYPFIVKSVSVQQANGSGLPDNGGMGAPNGYPPGMQIPEGMAPPPYQQPPQGMPQPMGNPVGRGGLQTVLKEKLLRVTVQVEIVQLLHKR